MDGLKAMIRDRLHGNPRVAEALERHPEFRDDHASLLRYLEEHGLVEDIFASLEEDLQHQDARSHAVRPTTQGYRAEPSLPSANGPSGGGAWQLRLRLREGRAFLDFLDERDSAQRELRWHVSFGGQRFRTPAVPASVDPRFDATVLLDLPEALKSKDALLSYAVPVHLVLTSHASPDGAADPWDTAHGSLVCSHRLEWRKCLATSGPADLLVELQGVGRKRQLAAGVLHGEVELLRPACAGVATAAAPLLPELGIAAQIRGEEQRRDVIMRQVFEDLDRWWSHYHELYINRHVRLFAQTESSLFLPVTSFVTPLEAGRSLDTPGQALRWASLLGSETGVGSLALEAQTEPRWTTFPALWARGAGTTEEKALLLCSLLLGYSLDAWCCLGTDAAGRAHAWVVVRDRGDVSQPADVACWDVKSVHRITADDAQFLATYSSIDTVFNHRRLYVCHADTVARVSFDFSDSRQWLAVPLEEQALEILRLYPAGWQPPFAELKPRIWGLPSDSGTIEEGIERRLSAQVRAHREAAGLATHFDGHLSQLLHLALVNCELERTGSPSHARLFEDIIRRVCTPEEVFRAVPAQFNHLRLSHYWPALSGRAEVLEALASPSPSPFALRARVVAYPEGAVAVWVLIAVRCRA